MSRAPLKSAPVPETHGGRQRSEAYVLNAQVGFILRQAQQRHTTIFASLMIEGLTPTQWAALAKLKELGPSSQNLLGRLTAMDAATIKGVIDRLTKRGLTATKLDPADGRRLLVALTEAGVRLYERARPIAELITEETLQPLNEKERAMFMALLGRMT
jgi:MarR family transcriptional regulator, lower aerobic nicotinate degradation pathway regulator